MLQKWMGHANMQITAIYANALGEEERAIAAKMWE
jgi:integrase